MSLKKLETCERVIVKLDQLLHSGILIAIAMLVLYPVGYTLLLLIQ